jgi:hypothetical protein
MRASISSAYHVNKTRNKPGKLARLHAQTVKRLYYAHDQGKHKVFCENYDAALDGVVYDPIESVVLRTASYIEGFAGGLVKRKIPSWFA